MGAREQRNRQEIGAGATSREFRGFATRATGTKKPPCRRRLPTMIRGLLQSPRGFPLPGSFLVPRSMAGKSVHLAFYGQCKIICFVVKKGIFPENLHNIDLLQLPQTPSKFNLASKKDQVSFSSDRDNVNAGQYCTENKQALPQTPH